MNDIEILYDEVRLGKDPDTGNLLITEHEFKRAIQDLINQSVSAEAANILAALETDSDDYQLSGMGGEVVAKVRRWLDQSVREAKTIIEDLADGDDCTYDHHGYCQTHGWFETNPQCPHKRAKAKLDGGSE